MSFLLVLITSEITLRYSGYEPGKMHYNQWFERVDSLVALQGFVADSQGIFKIDTAVIDRMKDDIRAFQINHRTVGKYAEDSGLSPEIAALVLDHILAQDNDSVASSIPFYEGNYSDCCDSTLQIYIDNPINHDGFYSVPFDIPCKKRTRVMLIGDSFVWGHSTTNNLLSFSNLLLAKGYLVFNLGISGADVSQYHQLLVEYVQRLEPDVVVVNFYMGNDLEFETRSPKSGVPIFYTSNAGNLYSFRRGEEFSDMDAAYNNVISKTFVPAETCLGRIASKLVFTTLIWKVVTQYDDWWEYYYERKFNQSIPESTFQLRKMNTMCDSLGLPFVVSLIPEVKSQALEPIELNKFEGVQVHCPKLETQHYNLNDGHFNDLGHMVYAEFLDSLIQEEIIGSE